MNGDDRTLRVLMYHKVNDVPGNRMSMPVSLFDEQMAQLRELGYVVVDLDAVLAHYTKGEPLPEGAVLPFSATEHLGVDETWGALLEAVHG